MIQKKSGSVSITFDENNSGNVYEGNLKLSSLFSKIDVSDEG